MLFYLLVILLSVLFYKGFERATIVGKVICLFFAILIPVVVEGLRNETVGVDMNGYGSIWFYQISYVNSLDSFIQLRETNEYAFLILQFICHQLSSDIHLYMTLCALIKITLIYATAYRLRKEMDTTIFLLSYFIFFYTLGFSLVRQSLALAICTFALTYLDKSYWKYAGIVAISYFFHNSGAIAFLLIPLYMIREWRWRYVAVISSALIFFAFFIVFFVYIGNSGLVRSDFIENYENSGVDIAKTDLLMDVCLLAYSVLCKYLFDHERHTRYMAITMCIFSITMVLLATRMETAVRVSYYFFIPAVMFFCRLLQRAPLHIRVVSISVFAVLCVLHNYVAYSHGMTGTLPYISNILRLHISR